MKVETQQVVTFDDGSKLIVPQHVQDFVWEALAVKHPNPDSSITIHAIRFLRAEFDLSLRNARELVGYWRGTYAPPTSVGFGQMLRDKLS